MRQKNTVYSPEFHNQFEKTKDSSKISKEKKAKRVLKDKREGQSEFWIKKETKRK